MEKTKNLNLDITTSTSWDLDDVKDTIIKYGDNFDLIDSLISDSINDLAGLTVGTKYPYAKKLLNSTPLLGGYIGWVNIREGVHAPVWLALKAYALGDLIRTTPDNGNVYECVTDGRSMANTPTFLTNSNVEFYDANGNQWMINYNYNINDVVFSTDGNQTFYYICETAGLSDITEPVWNNIPAGTTIIDGSVVWRKEKTVKWKQVNPSCNFRPFGKIE